MIEPARLTNGHAAAMRAPLRLASLGEAQDRVVRLEAALQTALGTWQEDERAHAAQRDQLAVVLRALYLAGARLLDATGPEQIAARRDDLILALGGAGALLVQHGSGLP